jgi:hypothetical protein
MAFGEVICRVNKAFQDGEKSMGGFNTVSRKFLLDFLAIRTSLGIVPGAACSALAGLSGRVATLPKTR